MRGLCPRAPGIYRIRANRYKENKRAADAARPVRTRQRSGRIPALPYPLPRFCQFTGSEDVANGLRSEPRNGNGRHAGITVDARQCTIYEKTLASRQQGRV